MGGRGRTVHTLLICSVILWGCARDADMIAETMVEVKVETDAQWTRAMDEWLVRDVCMVAFDEEGKAECIYRSHDLADDAVLRLMKDRTYEIAVTANINGYGYDNLEDLGNAYLVSGETFGQGIPMSGTVRNFSTHSDTVVRIDLERTMAKISLRLDRSRLTSDTKLTVTDVALRNCPEKVRIFAESRIDIGDKCMDMRLDQDMVKRLNHDDEGGMSEEISMYVFENLQGNFSTDGISSESEKVFAEGDIRKDLCTYMEIGMAYSSDSLYSIEKPLIYRFYLGDGPNSLDIERNHHYHITVCPEEDGISEDSWRIEKEGLYSYVQDIDLSDDSVEMCYHGESRHLDAKVLPAEAYEKTLKWESSDISVATVDNYGNVTAAGEGYALITCSSIDGSDISVSCPVLISFAPPRFEVYPEDGYINGDIGDTVRIRCNIFPPSTDFDIGLEYLEDDKDAGIYEYVIDEDGYGVTLILTGPGSGLIYMEAFEPINEAALFVIEVNEPDSGNDST